LKTTMRPTTNHHQTARTLSSTTTTRISSTRRPPHHQRPGNGSQRNGNPPHGFLIFRSSPLRRHSTPRTGNEGGSSSPAEQGRSGSHSLIGC
jgi:hypothetical protein